MTRENLFQSSQGTAGTTRADAIVVDEGEDCLDFTIRVEATEESEVTTSTAIQAGSDYFIIEDDDTDDDDESVIEVRDGPGLQSRDPLLGLTSVVNPYGAELTIGESWELVDGKFFNIESFVRMEGETLAQGKLFCRWRDTECMPRTLNELCMLATVDHEHNAVPNTEALHNFVTKRRLICTNALFPAFSFRENLQDLRACYSKIPTEIRRLEEHATLVCRWKVIDQLGPDYRRIKQQRFIRFLEADLDVSSRVVDLPLLLNWHFSRKSLAERFGQDRVRKLTFGDICAGAGGVSSGAERAGFQVKYMLDHWDEACHTLSMNFRGRVLQREVYEFIEWALRRPQQATVDVLHLSLPCQYFSPAHTCDGRNDSRNVATNLCIEEILKAVRPRVVTFEQTPGILWKDDARYFALLKSALISLEYSFRWRKINMAEYGGFQARIRVIIIAAAPGEVLPEFPKPTHGPIHNDDPRTGTKRFRTVQDALEIVDNMQTIPDNMSYNTKRTGAPYNPNMPLRHCITTNGGDSDLHPNGQRSFTLQQLAILQGFLPTHLFHGRSTSVKRQIGNAVPSCFAKVLFREIRKTLEQSNDRILREIGEPITIHDD